MLQDLAVATTSWLLIAALGLVIVGSSRRFLADAGDGARWSGWKLLAATAAFLIVIGLALWRFWPDPAPTFILPIYVLAIGLYLLYRAVRGPSATTRRGTLGSVAVIGAMTVVVGIGVGLKGPPAGGQVLGAAAGGYAPSDRPVFDCPRPTDCPGPGYAVFNSYINRPGYGDERGFVDARLTSDRPVKVGRWQWHDVLSVEPGDRVTVRVYYNNAGDTRVEAFPGMTTARRTRVAAILPYVREKVLAIGVNITADNTRPKSVSDIVTLRSRGPVNLVPVANTARINNKYHPRGLLLGKGLLSGRGVLIGGEKMDGVIRGCFCDAGYITFEVRVV